MKKALKYLLSATVLAVVGFCFAGCGGGEKTYEDEQGVVYSLKNNKYTVTSVKDKNATTFDIPESINGTPVTALASVVFAGGVGGILDLELVVYLILVLPI